MTAPKREQAPLTRIILCAAAAAVVTIAGVYWWREPAAHVSWLLLLEYLLFLPACLWAFQAAGSAGKGWPRIRRAPFLIAFVVMALAASRLENRGVVISDENSYDFQSRIFAHGKLFAAPLPGAPDSAENTPVALYFEHHFIDKSRWLTVYPPGWPAVLAAGQLLSAGWMLNPLMGLAILLLTAAIARRLFGDETATLAVIMGAVSPYVLLNCIDHMSQVASSLPIVAAFLLCFQTLQTRRAAPCAGMFACLVAAFQVRPFTAAVAGVVLGLAVVWHLRRERIWPLVLAQAALCGGICAASFFLYSRLSSGSFHSPYLYFHSKMGKQVDLSVAQAIYNLTHQTRWSLQETLFYTFPFVFLLAAYCVWREKDCAREVRILAAFWVALVAGYLVQPGTNAAELIGERYYFDAYFAVLILGARGLTLLARRGFPTRATLTALLAVFLMFEAGQDALAWPVVWERFSPYLRVRAAVATLGEQRYTVFLHGDDGPFVGKHFNLNRADWDKGAMIFLADPGEAERDKWACQMGRPNWVLIGYDAAAQAATKTFGAAGACP